MNKVLIVDDVPGWVRFHKSKLDYLEENFEIDVAYSAKEGLAKIECSLDNPYTTIFTDLQMEGDFLPKLAGEWFIEQIKMFEEYNNTKIVIISASPNIQRIAKRLEVECFPKLKARNSTADDYKIFL